MNLQGDFFKFHFKNIFVLIYNWNREQVVQLRSPSPYSNIEVKCIVKRKTTLDKFRKKISEDEFLQTILNNIEK